MGKEGWGKEEQTENKEGEIFEEVIAETFPKAVQDKTPWIQED